MTPFSHVCFTVPDLAAATRDLTTAVGAVWHEPVAGRLGPWDYTIVFTAGGPPFVELIEAAPGGPWGDTTRPGFHHLGFWTTDIGAGTERLARGGFRESFSGCPYGRPFAYHRVDSVGSLVELVDNRAQRSFLDTWHPDGAPMAAVDEDGPVRRSTQPYTNVTPGDRPR